MIQICQLENIKNVIEVFTPFEKVIDDINIHFIEGQGIHICRNDKSNILMIDIKYECEIEAGCVCRIDLSSLLKMTSSPVVISFDRNKLIFKQGRKTTEMTTIANQPNMRDIDFPEIKWEHEIMELPEDLVKDIFDTAGATEEIYFELIDNLLKVHGGATDLVTTKTELPLDIPTGKNYKSKYGSDSLNALLRYYKKFEVYKLFLGSESPIAFNMKNNNCIVSTILAPRFIVTD